MALHAGNLSTLIGSASPWCDPWSPEALRRSIEAGHLATALVSGDEMLGYGVCRVLPEVLEILNLVIFYPERSKGYGAILLSFLENVGDGEGCRTIWLEVRADNTPAIALYRSAGFRETARRRGYYAADGDARVDALLMEKAIR